MHLPYFIFIYLSLCVQGLEFSDQNQRIYWDNALVSAQQEMQKYIDDPNLCKELDHKHIPIGEDKNLILFKFDFEYWLTVYANDQKGRNLIKTRTNEKFIHQIMQRYVTPGSVAIDAGANYGLIGLTLSRLVGPTGKAIFFEASPKMAPIVDLNIKINGYTQAQLYHNAVMDKEQDVYMDESMDWYGLIQVSNQGVGAYVKGVVMDKVLQDLPEARFIRYDIQGSEMKALSGTFELIKRSKDVMITMEYETRLLEQFHDKAFSLKVLSALQDDGFYFFKVNNIKRSIREKNHADQKLLQHIYPLEIVYHNTHFAQELVIIRNISEIEGLFQNLRLSFSDFWSLSQDVVKSYLEKGYIQVNDPDFQFKFRDEILIQCNQQDCENFEQIAETLRALKNHGEDCSSVTKRYFDKNSFKNDKVQQVFNELCQ